MILKDHPGISKLSLVCWQIQNLSNEKRDNYCCLMSRSYTWRKMCINIYYVSGWGVCSKTEIPFYSIWCGWCSIMILSPWVMMVCFQWRRHIVCYRAWLRGFSHSISSCGCYKCYIWYAIQQFFHIHIYVSLAIFFQGIEHSQPLWNMSQ